MESGGDSREPRFSLLSLQKLLLKSLPGNSRAFPFLWEGAVTFPAAGAVVMEEECRLFFVLIHDHPVKS